jgi:hypothetical protein
MVFPRALKGRRQKEETQHGIKQTPAEVASIDEQKSSKANATLRKKNEARFKSV